MRFLSFANFSILPFLSLSTDAFASVELSLRFLETSAFGPRAAWISVKILARLLYSSYSKSSCVRWDKFCLREPSSNNFPASSLRADSGLGTTSRHLITWKFCIHSSKSVLTHQQEVSDSQIRSPVLLQCVHTDLPSGTHLVEAAQKFEVLIKLTFGWKILVRKNPFGGEAGKSFERTSLILNWPPGAVLYKSRCVFGPLNFGVCAMCIICKLDSFFVTLVRSARGSVYHCLNVCQVVLIHLFKPRSS